VKIILKGHKGPGFGGPMVFFRLLPSVNERQDLKLITCDWK